MDNEFRTKISLYIIRAIFFACSIGLGLYISESIDPQTLTPQEGSLNPLSFMIGGGSIALGVILVEVFFSKSSIGNISSIAFGLIMGFITSYLFVGVISLIVEDLSSDKQVVSYLKIISTLIFCYFGITVLLQTQEDFRFIIPYVEFSKEIRGLQPLIVDTSALIDGRIGELCELGVFDNRIVISRFVIDELQKIADSANKLKRGHGRRGLDVLNRLKNIKNLYIEFSHEEFPEVEQVDHKLLKLTEQLQGKIVTNDYNLNKVATIYNIQVVNVNDIAMALRPRVSPGEVIRIHLVREGEGANQAIGYLADGTLVVADNGKDLVGEQVEIVVRNIHQTSAGRMVFGSIKTESDEEEEGEIALGESPHIESSIGEKEQDFANKEVSKEKSKKGKKKRSKK